MMHITINALACKPDGSGIGVLLRELLGRYTALTDRPCRVILPRDGPDFPAGPGTEIVRTPWTYGQALRRMYFQTFRLGRRYCRDAVLLTTDSKTPFFLPESCVLVPIVTDLALYRLSEVYRLSRVLWWRLQYRYLRRRADFFLAVSPFTKGEMTALLGIPAEKIHVMPCACGAEMAPVEDTGALARLREKYGLPEEYILFVGNTNPRKNLERTVRAFARLKAETGLPHRLVIAGEQGWKFDRERLLAGVPCREDVRFTGFVPDGDMPALYSAASLFVFASLYEGFGIPVIEAQACGVPVVAGNLSALPETAGDGAVLVDPYDEGSICRGMRRVLEDPALAASLREKGFRNAERFSWDASARRLQAVIEEEVGP